MEVDTPLLARYTVTDPHMDVLTADNPIGEQQRFYLQTSPEYAMKRLLADDVGAIYQICKAFRRGEHGSRHNPEFTMLEWYRPNFDHYQLMEEVAALLTAVVPGLGDTQTLSYRSLFQQYLQLDPHIVELEHLKDVTNSHIDVQMHSDERDDWLNLLMAEVIEPCLVEQGPTFIVNYPASQAALARVAQDEQGVLVAQRFELYVRGIELANGYFELTDAQELRARFEQEQKKRLVDARPEVASDPYLLAAMESGLPSCAGVALGLDRLLMLAMGVRSIAETMAFPVDRA